MAHYGQDSPITYDLSKVLFVISCNVILTNGLLQVTAPTAIFKGDADDLADVQDIDRLVKIVSISFQIIFINNILHLAISV